MRADPRGGGRNHGAIGPQAYFGYIIWSVWRRCEDGSESPFAPPPGPPLRTGNDRARFIARRTRSGTLVLRRPHTPRRMEAH